MFKVDEITVIVFKNILFCVIVKDLIVYNTQIFGSRYYSFFTSKNKIFYNKIFIFNGFTYRKLVFLIK